MNSLSRCSSSLDALLIGMVLIASAANASSNPAKHRGLQHCADGSAIVAGAEEQDFADICQGVAEAFKFFVSHAVRPTEAVTIEVSKTIPAEAGPTAAGCYIEQKRRVFVLPYNAFRRYKTWFGVPIDRAIYRALATHEAAHAVAACNFRIRNPTIQAKEYLAYAATLSSLPPRIRSRALRATPPQGFDSLERFRPMLYMVDPMRFGAEAYRHYAMASDPSSVVHAILSGEALSD